MNLARSLAGVALASVVITTQFFASNTEPVLMSVWLFAPAAMGFCLGALWMWLTFRRSSNWYASSFSGSLGSLVFTAGGVITYRFGVFALAFPVVVMLASYASYRRIERSMRLGWLVVTWFLWLLLINAYFLVVAFVPLSRGSELSDRDLPAGPEAISFMARSASVEDDAAVDSEPHPDVIVVILDEMAALTTRPLLDPVDFGDLTSAGYSVREHIWSSYVVSRSSIAAILDGSHPLPAGEPFGSATIRELGQITQGENRLVKSLHSQGFTVTLVESGIWMTECGRSIDRCVPRYWLDEAVGTMIERSVLRPLYRHYWGHSLTAAGLHSLEELRQVSLEVVDNDERDAVIAHITIPHAPYILDEACQRVRRDDQRPDLQGTRTLEKLNRSDVAPEFQATYTALYVSYAQQAKCALESVVDLAGELDRMASMPPAVVVVGDHGTPLRNQLYKVSSEWSQAEVVERLSAFAMYRLPTGCENMPVDTTPQLMDLFLSCVTGEEPSLDRRHFLDAPAGGPVLAVPTDTLAAP